MITFRVVAAVLPHGHPGGRLFPGGEHRPARPVIAEQFPWNEPHTDAILGLFRGYTTRKRAGGLLDFDDLLLAWRSLLTDPTVGPTLTGRWDHVLVDEYQDVNQVQVDIVALLRPVGAGLTVVGDDAQAIYGFRGADAAHLSDLTSTLIGVTVVRLERNFRSRQPLLDLANIVRPSVTELGLRLYADRADDPAVCTDRGKCPATKWGTWATIDPEVIVAEWSGRVRNVGVACGKSGLLVIDEDKPGALQQYAQAHGHAIPATYTVATAKGRHYYFQQNGTKLGNAPGAVSMSAATAGMSSPPGRHIRQEPSTRPRTTSTPHRCRSGSLMRSPGR